MAAAVPLRSDFDAAQLRALAKRSRDPDQTRRLLALAAIYEGASRTEAAQIGCVTLQIVRDWVLRFNARGPEGLLTGRAPGAPASAQRPAPRGPAGHRRSGSHPGHPRRGALALGRSDPVALGGVPPLHLQADAEPRAARLGYRKLSARPRHHAKSEAAVAAFKKTSPPSWRRSRRTRPAASP